jgi:hypothetical protein
LCCRPRRIKKACPIVVFGPWLPRAAGADREQRTAAVLKEFVLGPTRRRGCQIPWRRFVDVVSPDAEAKDASHFIAAGAREIFDTILKPNILALLK